MFGQHTENNVISNIYIATHEFDGSESTIRGSKYRQIINKFQNFLSVKLKKW